MDKVLSTRIDEEIAQPLDGLAVTLRTSKKRIVEDAIRLYSETVERNPDPLEQSFGAWRRTDFGCSPPAVAGSGWSGWRRTSVG